MEAADQGALQICELRAPYSKSGFSAAEKGELDVLASSEPGTAH